MICLEAIDAAAVAPALMLTVTTASDDYRRRNPRSREMMEAAAEVLPGGNTRQGKDVLARKKTIPGIRRAVLEEAVKASEDACGCDL
jgi:hypothetical protein